MVLAAIIARETRDLAVDAGVPGRLHVTRFIAAKISATLQRNERWAAGVECDHRRQPGRRSRPMAISRRMMGGMGRTGEFLDVVEGIWHRAPFDHQGPLYRMEGGGLPMPQARERKPLIYFSGASEGGIAGRGAGMRMFT